MQAIEKASLLIDRLISPSEAAWLIYPKEIHIDLEKKEQFPPKDALRLPHNSEEEEPPLPLIEPKRKKVQMVNN